MTPTDEQVEAAARAMAENDGYHWAECSGVQREEYEDNARAAIAAYKPTVAQAAVDALAAYQQADMDGVMVLVSRQAIEECLPALRALTEPQQEGE